MYAILKNGLVLHHFKEDFGANARSVRDKCAAASAQFVDGVARIYVRPMRRDSEASLGGQQITYLPK